MNSKACPSVVPQLKSLLEGSLTPDRAGDVKSHLRECGDCRAAFLKLAAGEIFRAQVSFRSGQRIARWERLRVLAEAGVEWAEAEIERIRKALERAIRTWAVSIAGPIRARGARAELDKSEWPDFVEAPLNPSGDQYEVTVRLQILRAPTITRAGEFATAVCSSDSSLMDARLVCTIYPDPQTALVFERILEASETNVVEAMIVVTGMPIPEHDLILPYEQVCFSVQTE